MQRCWRWGSHGAFEKRRLLWSDLWGSWWWLGVGGQQLAGLETQTASGGRVLRGPEVCEADRFQLFLLFYFPLVTEPLGACTSCFHATPNIDWRLWGYWSTS